MKNRAIAVKVVCMTDGHFDLTFINNQEDLDKAKVDCALLGAAPDLLAALENMVAWSGKRGGDGDALLPADQQDQEVAQAMRAIAKAKGETK